MTGIMRALQVTGRKAGQAISQNKKLAAGVGLAGAAIGGGIGHMAGKASQKSESFLSFQLREEILSEIGGLSGMMAAAHQQQGNRSTEKANNYRKAGFIGGASRNVVSGPKAFVKGVAAPVAGFFNKNVGAGERQKKAKAYADKPREIKTKGPKG